VASSNVGWWIPALVVAVPLLLLLALHLLARLESWMFAPDDRADRVARLLDEVETPDEIETEVTRLLAEVADKPAPSPNGRSRAFGGRFARSASRVDRSSAQDPKQPRTRLRRGIARDATSRGSDRGPS
jgi:hypothetical protein